ncbi:MAG: exodeoxyribonuclease V subunit alpha [Chromatiales bacterium]
MWIEADAERDQAVLTLARHFAGLLARLSATDDPLLALVARRVSEATAAGHNCIDLCELATGTAPGSEDRCPPTLDALTASLRDSGVVGAPGDYRPLILDEAGRLYLYRYWHYEQRLARALRARAVAEETVEDARLREALQRYFPPAAGTATDWQQVAAAVAVTRRLCIISGGPGTGKTTTMVRILAILLELTGESPLRIGLAAPTGKAAARMKQAVRAAADSLPAPAALLERLPSEASTLHRLLGSRGDGRTFRYGPQRPLPLDVLIVDEVSMVDLALLVRLLEALPGDCRLILLGDRDQLAAVEPGAVLGELCGGWRAYTRRHAERLGALCDANLPRSDVARHPLQDCLVFLERNYRFGETSAIRRLAQAVSSGAAEEALAMLTQAQGEEIRWRRYEGATSMWLRSRLEETYAPYRAAVDAASDPGELIAALARTRVLCAHRHGPLGLDSINGLIEQSTPARGVWPWYPGRPVLVTRNDYATALYNGDLGVVWQAVGTPGPSVWFDRGDGSVRSIPPLRLPEHETAYALTVHKSQGSEFDEVLLVLPQADSPVLTRELVYTAITRARQRVEIWSDDSVLARAIGRALQRASGLRDALGLASR